MAIAKGSTATRSTTTDGSASTSRRATRPRLRSSTRLAPSARLPTHPGEMLLGEFLEPAGISRAELARRMGKTPASINELVKGKRGVSPELALLLADVLGTSAEFWMSLQMSWELWHARKRLKRVT